MKKRVSENEGVELSTICRQFKLKAANNRFYRLLRAAAFYRARRDAPAHDPTAIPQGLSAETVAAAVAQAQEDPQVAWDLVIATYLDGHISLGRAAELLRLSRFDLTTRFNRLELPLRLGVDSPAEVQAEVEALRDLDN